MVTENSTSFSSYLSIPASIRFRESIGGEMAIQEYTSNLAKQGGIVVSTIWNTQYICSDSLSMINVKLPALMNAKPDEYIQTFRLLLIKKYGLCVSSVFLIDGCCWKRFSAQIWNEFVEFEKAARVILMEIEFGAKL